MIDLNIHHTTVFEQAPPLGPLTVIVFRCGCTAFAAPTWTEVSTHLACNLSHWHTVGHRWDEPAYADDIPVWDTGPVQDEDDLMVVLGDLVRE